MRVRSLHLKNFRRHADTRLEVPDGVTALIGGNGAGKSTLLEGIAFALFGTDGLRTGKGLLRREGAPPGDGVSATLELELGGQALVVHRELKGKALTPSASLVVDNAVVVPAGAGSSEAVTQQLARRLGMGPEAFFTTIVARQGELARLANESPADRKRMVLRMVGVDRIDAAIEAARERRRQAQASVDALRRVAADPGATRARLDDARAQAGAALAAAQAREAAWAQARAELDAAGKALADLQGQAETRRTLAAQADQAARVLAHAEQTLLRCQDELQLAQAARQAADALEPAATRLAGLQAEWQEAQRALAVARQRALAEQALARLEADLAAARAAQRALAQPPSEEGVDVAEVDVEAAQNEVVAARTRLNAARHALVQAQERRRRVAALGADAPCPTCERPLGEHLQQMAAHTHDAAAHADDEVAAALAAEGQAAQRLTAARARRERAADAQRRRERHAFEAQAARDRILDLESRLAEAKAHLPPPAPAPAGLDQLKEALQAAQRSHDERQRHAGLAQRVPTLLEQTLQALRARDEAGLAAQLAAAALAAVPDPAAALAASSQALASAQAREREAERAWHDAHRQHLLGDAAVRHAEAAVAEQERLAGELAAMQEEARDWTALTDGHAGLLERFRDHVVDRIGPAIQAEASRLLAAFTGGRYTELLLDTSYNVYVTDAGVPYTIERFSGGEQDLAHLALRLAVSRLVAERSGGAEVRFLALDEVFGSQDAQRRDLVVSALRGLGGLYSQVLVVSHQEALQEALDQAIVLGAGGPAAVAQA